ncbi:hypothetical protein [Cytobacillus gottheilii]|uniref:hypothetical protein n=1 Tax=Cytobacillus gottheilii TaxID=859144 RepID=UPI0009B954CE|nr:hypothetical protein [Cytobacillus gottheilii]
MSNTLSSYTIFDHTFENKVCPLFSLRYFYINREGEREELTIVDDGIGTVLEDVNSTWEFRYSGVIVAGEVIFNNPDFLFGQNGLVGNGAVIGVALQIASKKSSQQHIWPIGEFGKGFGQSVVIDFEEELSAKQFYGSFNINICLYVKKADTTPILGKANIPGIMLGNIFEQLINIDGAMSTLPIQKVHDPLKPLWYVEYNIDDPTIDLFDIEHVCIYFNSAHSGFKYLEKQDSQVGTYLQSEVLASALTLIITHVKTFPEWDYIKNGDNLEEGSIGSAIHYFIKTFNWNFESPELLSESIRAHFENLGEEKND